MRLDNDEFARANAADVKHPRYVLQVSFDHAHEDVVWLTSHADIELPADALVLSGVIQRVSAVSQELHPDKGRATIGSLSFQVVDLQAGLTELMRARLLDLKGLKGKRVRLFQGYAGLGWGAYVTMQTQIVDNIVFKDGVYRFACADIQRSLKEKIFTLQTTALQDSITADQTTLPVFATEGFQTYFLPVSPSGQTDAGGQVRGYLKLKGENDQFEIVRYTGKTAVAFTGCTRGVLGTQPLAIEKKPEDGPDRAPKVEEYVYLEMPAPKLIYALLTGWVYGSAQQLPDAWHLGISPEYIATSDFVTIGADWWNPDDEDAGVSAIVQGRSNLDGKQFIGEQLCLMLGAYMPVYADGSLGLRRMTTVPSEGGYVLELNESNVTSVGDLQHDLKAVINRILLRWNWNEQRDDFTRSNVLVDSDSVAAHGPATIHQLDFYTLSTRRHTYQSIRNRFDAIRDRYAGPPLRLNLDLLPSHSGLEVGDIVRVRLRNVRDFTNQRTITLDRNFEVQRIQVDGITGKVSVRLLGSSQRAAGAVDAGQAGADHVLPDAWYESAGQELTPAAFPGAVSYFPATGLTLVTGNIRLGGASQINGNVWWTRGDLTIADTATVIWDENLQLRVRGFFQCNGGMDGKGRGRTGDQSGFFGSVSHGQMTATNGGRGVQFRRDHGEKLLDATRINAQGEPVIYDFWMDNQALMNRPGNTGLYSAVPRSDFFAVEGGFPSVTLSGTPGGQGSDYWFVRRTADYAYFIRDAAGGAGGAAGAGLAVVCRGNAFGGMGWIDVSGLPGVVPDSAVLPETTYGSVIGGAGAPGYPGAVYVVMDGASSIPDVSAVTATAGGYVTATPAGHRHDYRYSYGNSTSSQVGGSFFHSITQPFGGEDFKSQAVAVLLLVRPAGGEQPDLPEFADAPRNLIAQARANTPPTVEGNRSTIEVYAQPPVSDPAYSHALIQWRLAGGTVWSAGVDALPEALIDVLSDGATYELRALSVSRLGRVSSSGPTTSVTVDYVGDPFSQLPPSGFEVDESLVQLQNRIVNQLLFSWVPPLSGQIVGYQVTYQQLPGGVVVPLSATDQPRLVEFEVPPGTYRFEVRARSRTGALSDPAVRQMEVYGLSRAPDGVAEFHLTALSDQAHLSWRLSSDLNVRLGGSVEVRWSENVGADWSSAVRIGPRLAGNATNAVLPLVSGSYLAKFISSAGVASLDAARIVTTAPMITHLNFVAEVARGRGFDAWDRVNGVVVSDSGDLELAGAVLVDQRYDLIDDWSDFDYQGGLVQSVEVPLGAVDMGRVETVRVVCSLSQFARNIFDRIDDRDLMDGWAAFDGIDPDIDTCIQLRTFDGVSWGGWFRHVIGDVTAEVVDARLVINSSSGDYQATIQWARVEVDVPDRIEQAGPLTVPVAGLRVDYVPEFREASMPGVTAYGLPAGARVVVDAADTDGFYVAAVDSVGNALSQPFEISYITKGY